MMKSVLCGLWLRIRQCPLVRFLNRHHSPAPRTPPPPSQDLLDVATPLDQHMEDCENEEEFEWPPVRRFSHFGAA